MTLQLRRRKCFVAGTLVQTECGARPIEEIKTGDRVWAREFSEDGGTSGILTLQEVTDTFSLDADRVVDLVVRDDEGSTSIVTGTQEHPFYLPALGNNTPMGELKAGDQLLDDDGETITVAFVTERTISTTVYNFTVDATHNYFVQ